MNGAESLVRTLAAGGVTTCFANPGTSEMHVVDALDRTKLMKCVLGLFEGVVSGAADGYARMTGTPAMTLLHLAPGFANAAANLHNAKKARSPIINLVGDHASRHLAYDAPLTADVDAAVAPFSTWWRRVGSAASMGEDAAAALSAALRPPHGIATLIAPGETAWDDGGVVAPIAPVEERSGPDESALDAAADALRQGPRCAVFVGGGVLADRAAMAHLNGIAEATGARVIAPGSNRRIERGAGIARVDKLPYPVDLALERLAGVTHAILVEAQAPVAFFAYPNKPSELLPEGTEEIVLAGLDGDGPAAIAALCERVGALPLVPPDAGQPERPGAVGIDPETLAAAVGAALPEGAVVCDEGITAGRGTWGATAGAPPHTWLAITGGAIGIGPPLATGAAVGAPDRPVIGLQADGSAMYTCQALWTQARENLNVTTVIFANRGYEILKHELFNVGANPGRSALDMLEIDRPQLDFVALAKGMGVAGAKVSDARALTAAFEDAAKEPGPFVIEAEMV